MQNLCFELTTTLNIDVKTLRLFFFISEMDWRILNKAGPLIKVSITDGRRLILYYRHFVFFHGGHLETIQNGGWDPRYRVNILIFNQGCTMNNIIPLPESN